MGALSRAHPTWDAELWEERWARCRGPILRGTPNCGKISVFAEMVEMADAPQSDIISGVYKGFRRKSPFGDLCENGVIGPGRGVVGRFRVLSAFLGGEPVRMVSFQIRDVTSSDG